MTTYKVGYFVGSLSSTSINRELSQVLIKLAPEDLEFTEIPIGNLPLYNRDLDDNYPPEATALKEAIASSDAVLFITPEYNRSIPGVLKNAIDVGSRPYGKCSFLGKPIGIVSNSPGVLGGVSAAMNLKQLLPGITGPIMGQPEIYLVGVGDAFDDQGNLTKEPMQKVMKQYIDAYAAWVEKHNK